MSTAALVAIVAGGLVLVGAFATWIVLFIRRRRRGVQSRIAADLSSEDAVRGPESAMSQSGTGSYPRVGGNGRLALTRTRLIFRIYVGTDIVIPVDEITALRAQATYQRRRIGGRRFLVVVTDAGETAFAVRNIADWISAIEQVAPHAVVSG